jgi:hypothetical protein
MAPPYRIGKGPIVVLLDQFLKQDRTEVKKWYDQLTDPAYLTAPDNPTVFDTYLFDNDKNEHKHLVDEVFGGGDAGRARREVYGKGFRRALEMAYGFGGTDQDEIDPPWSIDSYWGCGQPFNLVALRVNPDRQVITALIYSDEVATGNERNVVPSDPTKRIVPAADGEFLIIDDRAGVGQVKEWRAARSIGLASSPPDPA